MRSLLQVKPSYLYVHILGIHNFISLAPGGDKLWWDSNEKKKIKTFIYQAFIPRDWLQGHSLCLYPKQFLVVLCHLRGLSSRFTRTVLEMFHRERHAKLDGIHVIVDSVQNLRVGITTGLYSQKEDTI